MYEQITDELGSKVIKKTAKDGREYFIPINEANSEYQRYLRWLEDPTAEESGTLS